MRFQQSLLKSISVFLTLSMFFSQPVFSEQGYKGARGIGLMSCEEFLRLREHENLRNPLLSWVYGYWTGLNFGMSVDESLGGPVEKDIWDSSVEGDALWARIHSRCIEDKSNLVFDAISEIFWALPNTK